MTKNQIQYVLSFSLTVDHLYEVAEVVRTSEVPFQCDVDDWIVCDVYTCLVFSQLPAVATS